MYVEVSVGFSLSTDPGWDKEGCRRPVSASLSTVCEDPVTTLEGVRSCWDVTVSLNVSAFSLLSADRADFVC